MKTIKTVAAGSIRFSILLPLAPQDLWPILTENVHIARWWGAYVTLEAVEGGAFRESWNNGEREVVTAGTVIEADRPRRLSMSWADDDWPAATTLSLEISSHSAEASRLELVHEGWKVHAPEKRQRLIADHAAGWEHHLGNLASYARKLRRS